MLTYPTKEEIQRMKKSLRKTAERVKGNPKLAREVLSSIDDRVLTEQPSQTPLERDINNSNSQ